MLGCLLFLGEGVSEESDLQVVDKAQYFPLFFYDENKNSENSLFDDEETNRYIRRDGITDWILKEVRNRFGGSRTITKEKVCQNARLLFLCTKPRLSQAGALLLPKDFVSLGIRISL